MTKQEAKKAAEKELAAIEKATEGMRSKINNLEWQVSRLKEQLRDSERRRAKLELVSEMYLASVRSAVQQCV